MTTITRRYEVHGLHCPSCAMSIDWEIEDVDGVVEARTSYAEGRTVVTFDPERVGDDQILAAVARAGFRAAVA